MCNAGLAPLNEVPTSYEMNSNSSYVMNASAADTSSPSKKRKMSNQDLPGPSSCKSNDTPVSEFYQSLLESSYQDDLNSMYLKKKKMGKQISPKILFKVIKLFIFFFFCHSIFTAERGRDDTEGITDVPT